MAVPCILLAFVLAFNSVINLMVRSCSLTAEAIARFSLGEECS